VSIRPDSTAAFPNSVANVFAGEWPRSSTRQLSSKTCEFVEGFPYLDSGGVAFRDQSCNRFLVAHDNDFLTSANSFEQIREMGFGLERTNDGHRISSFTVPELCAATH